MISYASVDRIEENMAELEVELIEITESRPEDFAKKETAMMQANLDMFAVSVREGNIFIVEHNGNMIERIWFRDELEEEERKEILKKLKKRI